MDRYKHTLHNKKLFHLQVSTKRLCYNFIYKENLCTHACTYSYSHCNKTMMVQFHLYNIFFARTHAYIDTHITFNKNIIKKYSCLLTLVFCFYNICSCLRAGTFLLYPLLYKPN